MTTNKRVMIVYKQYGNQLEGYDCDDVQIVSEDTIQQLKKERNEDNANQKRQWQPNVHFTKDGNDVHLSKKNNGSVMCI